ncbi:NAD(P)H-binding protein [Pengzhenrongella frigida]|uniref:NAD-dependent epimerase/dehydratase family protein n=1 Tax=Pengzhenrongella frigida TaxID=1259133 RepID=A0A4Q5N108_9MICO|nr:NAD(P)H-binding protein [Cellulomonas sp. HLT2-17]RYV51716.1 NAD-dependent epimerase/dehydratase family protein [Cellulomonas sp. HLT2-17]
MKIVIAGGHGQIALRLARQLADRGDEVLGLVRNPDHTADLAAAGARAVVADLERDSVATIAAHLTGADAVVFAAGAGPGSSAERKDTVDRAGAALLADAAARAGIRRYVLVSSMGAGAEPPAGTDEIFTAYLRAKTAAEEDLRGRDLDWTILRPGGLTNETGTGRVRLEPEVPFGRVARDDVAAVLVALLAEPRSAGRTLELTEGDVPIAAALEATL